MIRTAIVGAGLMGRWHADAAVRAGGRVVAVVDPRAERARAVADAAGGALTAASLPEIDLSEVDVVHVCTPTATHGQLARRVLETGCHAIVEKPMASGVAETEALLALAGERGRLLCPVHQYVFQRGVARAADALPRLGPILHVEVSICSAGADGRPGEQRGRVAAEILAHPLSLLAHLSDRPLDEIPWRVVGPAPGEIRALAAAGETSVGLLVSMAARPTHGALAILGTAGSVHVDLFHGFAVFEGGGVSRGRKIARPFILAGATLREAGANLVRRTGRREPAFPGLRELVGRCYAAIRDPALPEPIPAAETRAVAGAREAILGCLRER